MTRVALVSDVHLGAARHGVGGADAASDAAYGAFARLQSTLLAAEPEVVLLAGDLFDRHDTSERALRTALGFVRALDATGIPLVAIGGNHDAESPLPARLVRELPPDARWLSSEAPETVHVAGLAVHGQSVGSRDEARDLAAGYPDPVPGVVNIGLLHTSLTGRWSRRACAPTELATLVARGYRMWGLGHVHERIRLSDDPLVLYPGSLLAEHPAGRAARGFMLLEVAAERSGLVAGREREVGVVGEDAVEARREDRGELAAPVAPRGRVGA